MSAPSITYLAEHFRIETEFQQGQIIEIRRTVQSVNRVIWTMDKELGYGGSGEVWLEKDVQGGKTRAVKKVRKLISDVIDYRKELSAMTKLSKHKTCFVEFYGYYENPYVPNAVFFAMEYFEHGDLHKYLNSPHGASCAERDAEFIAHQLLQALNIMHSLGFAHRDLKPQNIFVVQRYPFWWIKLGDFGISKQVINDETALRTEIGTPSYLAPEVVSIEDSVGQTSYTNAVDMWSLGCVMYWFLTRAVPFSAREPTQLINFIRDGSLFPVDKLHVAGVSDEAIDFLKQLIVVQPSARMSTAKALEHPWLDVVRNTQVKTRIEKPRHGPDIRPGDIVIAVLGVTGTGKSTFISHFTPDALRIGHSLQSETRGVEVYQGHHMGKLIYLVDTPGFDDTRYSDTDVLREVAAWLGEAYTRQIHLTGIIYLHRITDRRMTGSAMKNLRMFKKLCGDDSLANVVLATTMWDDVSEPDGQARETELATQSDFWGSMIARGSRVLRHDKGMESATLIVDYLISRRFPVVLDIQRQMIEGRSTLDQTSAGQEISSEILRRRALFEKEINVIEQEMQEAVSIRDFELQKELGDMRSRIQDQIKEMEAARLRLNATRDELRQQLDAKWAREWSRLLGELRRTDAKMVQDEMKLKMVEHSEPNSPETLELKRGVEIENLRKKRMQKDADELKDSMCQVM